MFPAGGFRAFNIAVAIGGALGFLRSLGSTLVPDLDHNGGFGPGADAKNLRQSSAVRWYLAACGFPASMGPALR